ncbi:hypothetical protein RKE25_22130 (plasmid) [Dyella sp. BiH032]|uniref:hypothetical protein n=1 Tax=Dyella sp. BiH032 TaxID=3075430 RepID=UPI00289319EE|nr:hypothetical protein [Dyella sp. BiH032]WNL48430.1 hypothetical protein RKE25_22130 [Dyella sp. BiH032]
MTDKAPVITFKNLSEHRGMSEETICYEATLLVDGVRAARVENSGKGGMTSIWPVDNSDKVKALLQRAKAFALTQTWDYDGKHEPYGDLESYIDALAADELSRKDLVRRFGRQIKDKVLVLIGGDIYTFKCAFNDTNCAAIKRKHGDNVKILNAMPRDEAIKLFVDTVTAASKRAAARA